MAHFTRVRVDLAAWGYNTGVSKAEFDKFDQLYKAINGDDGGTWAPSSAIVIGGSGLIIDSASLSLIGTSALTVAGSASISGQLSATGNVILGDSFLDTISVAGSLNAYAGATVVGAFTAAGNLTLGYSSADTLTVNATATHAGPQTHNGAETHNGAATFNGVVTLGGSTGNGTNSHGPIIEGVGSGYAGHYIPSITWVNDTSVTVSSRSTSKYIWQAITASRTAVLAFSGTRNGETVEFVNPSASYLVSIYANGSADALGTIGGAADQYHRCELIWNLGLAGWSLVFS